MKSPKKKDEILASEFLELEPDAKLLLFALDLSVIVILLIAALAFYFFVRVPTLHVVHISRHDVGLFCIQMLRPIVLNLKILLHVCGGRLPRRLLNREFELLLES